MNTRGGNSKKYRNMVRIRNRERERDRNDFEEVINKWLKLGLIRKSTSKYSTPAFYIENHNESISTSTFFDLVICIIL